MGICHICQSSKNQRKNDSTSQKQNSSYDKHKNTTSSINPLEMHNNKKTHPTTVADNASLNSTDCTLPEKQMSFDNAIGTLLNGKTSNQLLIECTNCVANGKNIDFIYSNCESVKRIILMLKEYIRYIDVSNNETCLLDILTFKDKYTLLQITNDFVHIQDHMHRAKNVAQELVRKFRNELQYTNSIPIIRRRRIYHRKIKQNTNSVFSKIYSCLTHVEIENIHSVDNNSKFKHHIGKKEDDKWWDYDIDDQMEQEEMDQYIYCHLIKHMNIFRWQSAHGFNNRQHHALMH
eukprot:104399_1